MTAIYRLVVAGALLFPTAAAAQSTDHQADSRRVLRNAPIRVERTSNQADERPGEPLEDRWSRTFKLPGKGSLDLSNVSGEIVVTGGTGDEIRVNAIKQEHTGRRGRSDGIRIVVNEDSGRVEIRTEYPHHGEHGDVDFTVQVPEYADVSIRSVSGGVKIEKVHGDVRAESVSGSVLVADARKLELAKSVSGEVTVSGAAGDVINAHSVSGTVRMQGLTANTCDLGNISGELILTDTKCGRAHAKTISGVIEYSGAFTAGGRYDFSSHSGDVRLSVGSGTGFQLIANTFSGSLRCDLPLKGTRESEQSFMPNRELRGTVGDGSAYVVVKTFSGSVLVGSGGTDEPARKRNPHRRRQ